jgi:hypothetical protein
VYLWLWGVVLVDNRLLDLVFWSNQTICLLNRELSLFTFRAMTEGCLLIPVSIAFFPQVFLMLIILYFWHYSSSGFAGCWIDHACYFPNNHGFIMPCSSFIIS